jgi:hypothetical protein
LIRIGPTNLPEPSVETLLKNNNRVLSNLSILSVLCNLSMLSII